MTRRLKAFGIVAILAASIAPASAADPAYCEAYANIAVSQYQLAVAKGIPNLNWPRWHGDVNGHRWWCLQAFVTQQAADAEIAARHSVIN